VLYTEVRGHKGFGLLFRLIFRSLSEPTLNRLKKEWSAEYEEWSRGSLGDDQWIYLWVDGVYCRCAAARARCAGGDGATAGSEKRLLATAEDSSASTECRDRVLRGLHCGG